MALSTMSLFPASDDVGFIHRVSVISTINERLGRFGNKPIVILDDMSTAVFKFCFTQGSREKRG
eukprot:2599256-Prymnesium_polylepis.1